MPPVYAIFGPTGVGKTAVAIALADRLRATGADPVAISADALQVYEGLGILTGAASEDERRRLEHRLLGFLPIDRSFSVAQFAARAHDEIDGALAAGRTPIVVGGTGLYLRAALTELELRPPPAPGVRERLMAELHEHGPQHLHARLDAQSAERIAPTDSHRIVRALETGGVATGPQLWTSDTRHSTVLAGLTMQREQLYRRIERRVDAMVAAGAVREVREADRLGASMTARKALGFDELLQDDVEAMKSRTRRYAKRQLTWMRKLPNAHLIDVTGREPEAVAADIGRLPPG